MNFQIQSLPIKSEVALFFLVCATIGCFTQILTNSAVASLFIPILIVICQEVRLDEIKSNIVELPCLNAKMSYPIFYIFLLIIIELYQSSPILPTSGIHLFVLLYVAIYYSTQCYRIRSCWNENVRYD